MVGSGLALGGLFGVHRLVGPLEEVGQGAPLAGLAAGHAEADGQGIADLFGGLVDAPADPAFEPVELVGFGQHDGELVAAQAADDVGLPAGRPESVGHQSQSPVALGVPIGVIDRLEMVDIEIQGNQRALRPGGLLELLLGQQHERPAVVEAGDVVDQRQFPELLVEPVALLGILDPVDEVPECLEGRTETLLCVAKPGVFAVSHKPRVLPDHRVGNRLCCPSHRVWHAGGMPDVSPVEVEEVVTERVDEGDHDRFAHVVFPASAVMEAMITGVPCTALCGKRWVPSRDPKRYPVCPTCKEIVERSGHSLPSG